MRRLTTQHTGNVARILLALVLPLAACQGPGPSLETRTFEVQDLPQHQVSDLVRPYVFTDREANPGMMSTAEGAVTVRETSDNLDRIARILEEYDRAKPTVVLHFQIIEADGAGEADPAIAEVERELRRVLRYDGYRLVAETQVTAIQGTSTRQVVGHEEDRRFLIHGGVSEVRRGGDRTTVTLDVALDAAQTGLTLLVTSVTIPTGHSVVLGTANAPGHEGALILVVRVEIVETGP